MDEKRGFEERKDGERGKYRGRTSTRDRERGEEHEWENVGGVVGDLCLRICGLAQSCLSPLSNYSESNNLAFSHMQLQISPLSCRLAVLSLRELGGGLLVMRGYVCVCVCVCVCVLACEGLKVCVHAGSYGCVVGREQMEGTFPGWEMAVFKTHN